MVPREPCDWPSTGHVGLIRQATPHRNPPNLTDLPSLPLVFQYFLQQKGKEKVGNILGRFEGVQFWD